MDSRYRLYGFGSNGEGQLGLNYTSDKVLSPTEVRFKPTALGSEAEFHSIHKICGGGNHTLILMDSRKIWAAGSNQYFELFFETPNRHIEFTQTYENVDLCAAAWESTCGITNAAQSGTPPQVYTHGRQSHGELGRADIQPRLEDGALVCHTNHQIVSLPCPVVDLAAGMYHYVAVLENGQVWGWGRSNKGQLRSVNDSNQKSFSTPTRIDIPFAARRATCGQNFTYIVGDPSLGDHIILGDDKHSIQSKPETIMSWKDVGATWNAIFVLFSDGSLVAWGKSNLWKLVPPGLPKLDQIAVGSDHILAITKDDRRLISWGWAEHGNCGDTSNLTLNKGYVTGQWNDLTNQVKGEAVKLGAGYSTSFVLTREPE
jgi:protein ATS1